MAASLCKEDVDKRQVKLLSGEELPEVLEWLDEQAEAGEAGR